MLPSASADDRHRALALASQLGHAGVVGVLLDAGEDPNRYNPPGTHAHSPPLHQPQQCPPIPQQPQQNPPPQWQTRRTVWPMFSKILTLGPAGLGLWRFPPKPVQVPQRGLSHCPEPA